MTCQRRSIEQMCVKLCVLIKFTVLNYRPVALKLAFRHSILDHTQNENISQNTERCPALKRSISLHPLSISYSAKPTHETERDLEIPAKL